MTTAPARLYGPNGQPVNGHTVDTPKRAAATQIRLVDFPINLPTTVTPAQTLTAMPVPVEQHTLAEPVQPTVDPLAEAQAEAIRLRAAAEAEERRIKAEADAKAIEITAAEESERQRIANERARMKLEKDQAAHATYLAEKSAKEATAKAEAEKTIKESAATAERDAERAAEQDRSERAWKWAARGIYAVGLAIAAPIQFIAFWDPHRKFLIAAPALLEGLALALACGAAWAVAHRRDVMPYRVGIMLGASLAAGINLWHGITNPSIGLNAGLIGALASLGGPIVLMAYEHGMAQKADGNASRRERRSAAKEVAKEKAARDKARADRKAAEEKAAADKRAAEERAQAEQKRRDDDRQAHHPEVWEVAEALRSARGSQTVTEQIWGEAWYRVTGSKLVGINPEIEALSREAQARMKAAVGDASSQVESQMNPSAKRAPDAPDGRRFNGGTPPLRRPGDSAPYSPAAKKQAAIAKVASNHQKED